MAQLGWLGSKTSIQTDQQLPYFPLVQHILDKGSKLRLVQIIGKLYITKTRLYNFDPLKPHFYTVKLGLTGVYIIFLITA